MKKESIKILKEGGIGIAMTDTIYGILGSAFKKEAVERIYKIKGRSKDKPFIILIASIKDIQTFGIKLDKKSQNTLKKYWPGKVSIILECKNKKFEYLHRGQKSLAFRLPKGDLKEVLKKTGPLVAPSANPQGKTPASSIKEAKKYFKEGVDFYDSGRKQSSKPSKLIKIEREEVAVLRA